MHYQQCRWHVFCNAQTALVMYLAQPDVLFVSDVIHYDAGEKREALTIAMALLALLTCPPDNRPTCSFNNESLRYHLPLFFPCITNDDDAIQPESPLLRGDQRS